MKFAGALWLTFIVFPVLAEVDARLIAMNCMNCHQADSPADAKSIPSLTALSERQLLQVLLDFKYDKKPATLMPRIAKGFSDSELAALASYLSRP
ncbi:c-type cytochrome [Methylomonas sp. LL1]|uniref:c-type cytochrome n=1 Tax=Methylomonas sp. LL1 TaxID=2785785 RepID=UPI0018C41969|nr:c-type cytochrome [Methylomonas sp. LL1]